MARTTTSLTWWDSRSHCRVERSTALHSTTLHYTTLHCGAVCAMQWRHISVLLHLSTVLANCSGEEPTLYVNVNICCKVHIWPRNVGTVQCSTVLYGTATERTCATLHSRILAFSAVLKSLIFFYGTQPSTRTRPRTNGGWWEAL